MLYLETYYRRRPHHGRGKEGRTPCDVFKAGIPESEPANARPGRR